MPLSERIYRCGTCGFEMDRDLNARRNLAMLAASSAESLNARGEMASKGRETLAPLRGVRNPASSPLVAQV